MRKNAFIWLTFIAVVVFGIFALHNNRETEKVIQEKAVKKRNEQGKLRFDKGPFIANEKTISDTEVVKTIVYPGHVAKSYSELFDTTCLIYINTKINSVSMKCNGDYVNETPNPINEPEPKNRELGRYE